MQEPRSTVNVSSATQWQEVCHRIARATEDAGRRPQDVTLVCVSKTYDEAAIRPILQAGQRVFGENRVQEAQGKWGALRSEFTGVELHLIGPLQTNKVAEAVALFDCIETLDRTKLAEALAAEFKKTARRPTLYVQVNTGGEPQKAGISPEALDAFVMDCRERLDLKIQGLMCIPPVNQQVSPHFGFLLQAARRLALPFVSMGMSGDFELAIQLGATHVRVGSAIFGARS